MFCICYSFRVDLSIWRQHLSKLWSPSSGANDEKRARWIDETPVEEIESHREQGCHQKSRAWRSGVCEFFFLRFPCYGHFELSLYALPLPGISPDSRIIRKIKEINTTKYSNNMRCLSSPLPLLHVMRYHYWCYYTRFEEDTPENLEESVDWIESSLRSKSFWNQFFLLNANFDQLHIHYSSTNR